MSVIYEPQGRAYEYSELACNLYLGCTHGCTYCYAPACMRTTKDKYKANPHARAKVMEQFQREAAKLAQKGDRRTILFSFLSDPYQPLERELKLTRQALQLVGDYQLRSKILTKGSAELIERDLTLMQRAGTELGITLCYVKEATRKAWEPQAASVQERMEILKKAHDMGIKTWVSLEPVIVPEEALEVIRTMHPFVDSWKVGKINHCPDVERTVDWIEFRQQAKTLLDGLHADYYLKKSLTELG